MGHKALQQEAEILGGQLETDQSTDVQLVSAREDIHLWK
jgi:hypothetical protein